MRYTLLAITFDDAYVNLLDNALPVLAAYGLPATIFAPVNYLGKKIIGIMVPQRLFYQLWTRMICEICWKKALKWVATISRITSGLKE